MTLYYPQGLYGPICDIQPTADVESVVREVTIQEPNIQLTDNTGITGGTTPTTTTGIIRVSPKVCKTVKISTLLGGGLGPICDVAGDGGDGAYQLCPDDFEPPDATYQPLGGFPPEFPLETMTLDCKSRTIELPSPTGTKTVTYFYECRPGLGNYTGPEPGDYGLPTTKKKIKYTYDHSLVCGSLDYYNSPGLYTQSIPQGINLIDIFAFGGGGGAGGKDQANGSTGSGNNSGGTGSFVYATVNLDPSIANVLHIVVGGGGKSGKGWHNRPEITYGGFNRGGKGGYPGPSGVSGAGGSGGGCTDIFLNYRLIMSIGGGGGGGGNGCNFFRGPSNTFPYGNWNNYTYNNNPLVSSDALKRTRFSPLMAVPVFEPNVKHSLWSNWFNQYVVWFDTGDKTLPGVQLENRVNLNFDVAGTYTIQFQGDNQLALYIAPWYDQGEGSYITDNMYNGSTSKIIDITNNNNTIPVNSDGVLQPPSTLPAEVTGAATWTYLGYTTNFTTETPTSVTYTVTTPGRYVLRTFLENAFGASDQPGVSNDWLYNPGGMAIVVRKPNGSIMWTTRSAFGNAGQNRASNDGSGGGGGGGNEGMSGLSAAGMGLSGGSCSDADSTSQGGSAGWSYVVDHPAINVEFFGQAPSGFISGWNTPTPTDASVRKGGGGFGGGRPYRLSLIFNGTEYQLYNNNGSFKSNVITGMGTGVWADFMDGKTFQYHYFWGTTRDGSPDTTVPELVDSGDTYGKILLGSYEGAVNSTASQRTPLYRARSLELAMKWTPIKTGPNTWNTQIRLVGIPDWGEGTGFAVNDLLTGVMPPSKSQGTQPWWDITTGDSWHTLQFYDDATKTTKLATIPGATFNFQIKVTSVTISDDYRPTDGKPGFVRTQFYSADYTFEDEEI